MNIEEINDRFSIKVLAKAYVDVDLLDSVHNKGVSYHSVDELGDNLIVIIRDVKKNLVYELDNIQDLSDYDLHDSIVTYCKEIIEEEC